ncbi:MAG: M28 family peptidase [Candidatus Heimdallarchaeota archaeon]|nr:M28 family peptidase [Candidatus Heimdallarchaeota archaeon]
MTQDLKERIVGRILSKDSTYETIKDLCLMGSRFSGTESEKVAQEYMNQFLERIGVSAENYEFDYQGWMRGECDFSIKTKNKEYEFSAISLVLAPSTNSQTLEMNILDGAGGSETELKRLEKEIPGKAVMIHSGNTEEGWLHRRIKYANAYEFGAKAFVFANHNPGQLFPTGSVRSNRIGEIIAIGISKESYEHIKELLEIEGFLTCKINVSNDTPKLISKHIIWEIPGKIKDEVIVIGGHYDGHDIAQGATDNAASIAAILEISRLMKEFNYVPERTLRFMAFGVEEFGVVGSTIYVNNTDLSDVVAMINLDGLIGHIPKHIPCSGIEELFLKLKEIENELLYEAKISKNIITASDNYPFFLKGIPNVCIFGEKPDPRVGRGYGHTSADTFDKISKLDAKISTAFAFVFIDAFCKMKEMPMKLTKNEVIDILQEAKLEDNLRLLEKWPFK